MGNHFCNIEPETKDYGSCMKMSYIGDKCNPHVNSILTWPKKDDTPDNSCILWDSDKPDKNLNQGYCLGGKCQNKYCVSGGGYNTEPGVIPSILCASNNQGIQGPKYCVDGKMYTYTKRTFFNISLFSQDRSAVMLTVIMSFVIVIGVFYIVTSILTKLREIFCCCCKSDKK